MDIPTLNLRWGEAQTIELDGTSAQSRSFGRDTWVILNPSGDCWVTIGEAPTATSDGTAGSIFLPAGSFTKIMIPKDHLVAVVQEGTATGFLNIIPSVIANTLG